MKKVTAARIVLSASTVVAGFTAVPAIAGAAGAPYVALGDSYSAGVGTRYKIDACYRSPQGYPVLVANARGWTLNYQACSGAVLNQIITNQMPAVTSATRYVTVTGGGNDAGFADGLTECAKPGWMSNCNGKLDYAERVIRNDVPGRLDTLFGGMRSRAPQATRMAVGYPHIFMGEDCNALTFFSPSEESRINSLTDLLNGTTRSKSSTYGMRYVDPVPAFTGHAVCDNPEWINGLSNPIEESYHPNDAGNVGYANLVQRTVGATTTVLVAPTATARVTAETASAEQYQQVVPDLATPENLEKARRGGLDAAEIQRLDADLRSGNRGRARAAFVRLKQLDRQYRATHGG